METNTKIHKEIKEKILALRNKIFDDALEFYKFYQPEQMKKIQNIFGNQIPPEFSESMAFEFQMMSEVCKAAFISECLFSLWKSMKTEDKVLIKQKEKCLEIIKKCIFANNRFISIMTGKIAALLQSEKEKRS